MPLVSVMVEGVIVTPFEPVSVTERFHALRFRFPEPSFKSTLGLVYIGHFYMYPLDFQGKGNKRGGVIL